MKLFQSPRLAVASRILAALAEKEGAPLKVSAYVNGNEEGYHLTNYTVSASFAKDQSTGLIVIQVGQTRDFAPQGHVLRGEGLRSTIGDKFWVNDPDVAIRFLSGFFADHPARAVDSESIESELMPLPALSPDNND